MRRLRSGYLLLLSKRTRGMADSGTKAEVSHRECVGTEKPSSWAFVRPGVSSRERSINPQQPPEEGLHPWDTSVFVPEFLVCCVLLRDSISFLASFARLSHSGDSHSRALAVSQPASARVTQVVSPCSRASAGSRARECKFRCTCRGPRWQ